VTVACAILAGCALPDPGDTAQPITGGAADPGQEAVVALLDRGALWCTGAVIGPHTVLTAGHCVALLPRDGELTVFFGDDVAGTGTTVAVAEAVSHPDLDLGSLASDLALITLREVAPATPLALDTRTLDATFVGTSFTAVGFGRSGPDADDAGLRRATTSAVSMVDADEITAVADPGQACELDSGGPALFDDGGPRVAGVVSRGDPECADHATYARVDVALDGFIQPYLDATAPGSVHTGDPCLYEGQCAEGACLAADDDPRLYFCAQDCAGGAACPGAMECVDDQCRHPAPSPGADGWPCTGDDECSGEICYVAQGADDGVCTESCLGTDPVCPTGFSCQNPSGIQFYCLAESGGDGCCSAGGRGASPPWLLLLLLAIAAARPALARGKIDHR
jgi:hypothetical protein